MKVKQKPKIDIMQRRGLVKRGVWRKAELVPFEKPVKKTVLYNVAGAAQAAIFSRTSKSIFYFLKENRGKVTEAARLGLLAYAVELRRIGK